MKIQASVIQVDGAHHRHLLIHHTLLGMEETGGIFVNAHACLCQVLIIGTGHLVDHLFVRDTRRDNAHIHATGSRLDQFPLQLIGDHEIRCGKPGLIFRILKQIHVNILAYMLCIQRRIPVGCYEAFGSFSFICVLYDFCIIFLPYGLCLLRFPCFFCAFRNTPYCFLFRKIQGVILIRPLHGIPHFQEHDDKALNSLSL